MRELIACLSYRSCLMDLAHVDSGKQVEIAMLFSDSIEDFRYQMLLM